MPVPMRRCSPHRVIPTLLPSVNRQVITLSAADGQYAIVVSRATRAYHIVSLRVGDRDYEPVVMPDGRPLHSFDISKDGRQLAVAVRRRIMLLCCSVYG